MNKKPKSLYVLEMLLQNELESWRLPKRSIYCLLCKESLDPSDSSRYQKHLKKKHSVVYNVSWLINCTLLSQKKGGKSPILIKTIKSPSLCFKLFIPLPSNHLRMRLLFAILIMRGPELLMLQVTTILEDV